MRPRDTIPNSKPPTMADHVWVKAQSLVIRRHITFSEACSELGRRGAAKKKLLRETEARRLLLDQKLIQLSFGFEQRPSCIGESL